MRTTPGPSRRPSRLGRSLTAALVCVAAVLGLTTEALAATPTVQTLPTDATLLSDSYALLSGVVNPKGFNVVYRFEWGTTTAYGNTTPVTPAGNGKADVPVDVSLDDIRPNTTYHYRLVASPVRSDGDYAYLGDIVGEDQSFTTPPRLGVRFASKKAKVAKRKAKVKLKAVGPAGERAAGKLVLKLKKKTLGTARYRIAVGKRKTIAVKLDKAALKALHRAAHHKLKVIAQAKTKGVKKPVKTKLVLKA